MIDVETIARAPLPVRLFAAAGRERQTAVARRLDWQGADDISHEWEALARNCLDPNPFLEPSFALSLAQHSPPEKRPDFLAIREASGERRLIGMIALERSGTETWKSPFVALGTPMLRRGFTHAALDAAHAWQRTEAPWSPGFMFHGMDARGQTCRSILSHALRSGLPIQEFDRRKRAALVRDDKGVMLEASGKRPKELGRLLRRLQEKGEVVFTSARSVVDVRNATEHFLALEAQGWKGEHGSALVCDPALATFTRAATRRAAGLSRCRIETMWFNGQPIASGIVLTAQDHAAFWKIAFDERFAAYSPGAQLTLNMGHSMACDPDLTLVDSCALPDHPMIDRLWVGRREIIDILIGDEDRSRFDRAVQMEFGRRNLRRMAKSAYMTLTGRLAS